MSDHISGPRAMAEPIADITDAYAFPSPEVPGRLVLVMNTLPFAPPSARFSDGLVYRFRLRPVAAGAGDDPAPFAVGAEEFTFDCVFSPPVHGSGAMGPNQDGACTTAAGETLAFSVDDEQGGSAHGVRVFAGPRWDPFIMDAPAALETIATGRLAFTDPGTIYLDGKNVLSLVVEVDCARLLGGAELVGVVAETLTRGTLAVRLERVGRPEVKNLLLAPKQFDQVNRDLEIRDLYNMEDAFRLAPVYQGAYRARLNANLAFWDGLDDNQDWKADEGDAPPADRAAAGGLPRRGRHQAVRRAGLLPGDRAGRPWGARAPDLWGSGPQRRRDGHAVHAAGQRRERAKDPRRRRPGDDARFVHLPVSRAAEPGSSPASRAPLGMGRPWTL